MLGVGGPANVTVFDPNREWTPSTTVSKARNSPYFGLPLRGKPTVTVYRGTVTSVDGDVADRSS